MHFVITDHFSVSRNNTDSHRKMQNEEEATLTPVQTSSRTTDIQLQRIVLGRGTVNVSAIRALGKFWNTIFGWFSYPVFLSGQVKFFKFYPSLLFANIFFSF